MARTYNVTVAGQRPADRVLASQSVRALGELSSRDKRVLDGLADHTLWQTGTTWRPEESLATNVASFMHHLRDGLEFDHGFEPWFAEATDATFEGEADNG